MFLDFRGKREKIPIEEERIGTSKESQVKKYTIEKAVKMLPKSVLKWQCKTFDRLTNYIIKQGR